MIHDAKLKSVLLHCSNRTYFFDLLKSEQGPKYLIIKEDTINNDGHEIIVGQDTMPAFVKALHQLLTDMGLEEPNSLYSTAI
jgi:hypothetical protein